MEKTTKHSKQSWVLINQKLYFLGSPHFCIESVIVHFLNYVYNKIGSTEFICLLIWIKLCSSLLAQFHQISYGFSCNFRQFTKQCLCLTDCLQSFTFFTLMKMKAAKICRISFVALKICRLRGNNKIQFWSEVNSEFSVFLLLAPALCIYPYIWGRWLVGWVFIKLTSNFFLSSSIAAKVHTF